MIHLQWQLRDQPLTPAAVMVLRTNSTLLGRWLARVDGKQLDRIRGVYTDSEFILLGTQADLPWLPGQTYLGIDPLAPHLYLSTYRSPTLPVDIVQQAVFARWGAGCYIINPLSKTIIPVQNALAVRPQVLSDVLQQTVR